MSDYETALIVTATLPWATGLLGLAVGSVAGYLTGRRARASDRELDRQVALAEREQERALGHLRHVAIMAQAETAISQAEEALARVTREVAVGRASVLAAAEPEPVPAAEAAMAIAGSDLPPRGEGLPDWDLPERHPDADTIIAQTLTDQVTVAEPEPTPNRPASGPPGPGYRWHWPVWSQQLPTTPVRGVMPRRWLVRLRTRATAALNLVATVIGRAVGWARSAARQLAASIHARAVAARHRLAALGRRRERIDALHQWVRDLSADLSRPLTRTERWQDLRAGTAPRRAGGRHRPGPGRYLASDWRAQLDDARRHLMPTVGGRL